MVNDYCLIVSGLTHHFSLITSHLSLLTHHSSLITCEAFASRSRLVCSVRRALPLRARGLRAPCASLLTFLLQNYYIAIAVHEYSRQFLTSHSSLITHHFSLHHFFLVILVIWSFVKIENGCCQNRHYNINILFIYSEQITAFPKSKMTK